MHNDNTVTCNALCVITLLGGKGGRRYIILMCFRLQCFSFYFPRSCCCLCVFDSVEVSRRCRWWWKNKDRGIKNEGSWSDRNESGLQGETGRLFVFISNSLHNLHGCLQPYTARKDYACISPRTEAGFPFGPRSIYLPFTRSQFPRSRWSLNKSNVFEAKMVSFIYWVNWPLI